MAKESKKPCVDEGLRVHTFPPKHVSERLRMRMYRFLSSKTARRKFAACPLLARFPPPSFSSENRAPKRPPISFQATRLFRRGLELTAATETGAVCAEIPRKTELERGFGEWPVGFLASPLLRLAVEGSPWSVLCWNVTRWTWRSCDRLFGDGDGDWWE